MAVISRVASKRLRLQALDLMLAGATAKSVAEQVGVSAVSVGRWCRQAGIKRGGPGQDGRVIPANVAALPVRTGHARRLSLAERTKIELRLQDGWSQARIAEDLGVHRSTISRELARNTLSWGSSCTTGGPADSAYNAAAAQHHTDYRRARPKIRKLHTDPVLRHQVLCLMADGHSPPQVSVRLQRLFPDDERMRISHESIYQELYLQARSVLLQELKVEVALRTKRTGRIPASKLPPSGRGRRSWVEGCRLADREQMFAAQIADRKIPGHWEGDLVVGPGNSALITLVERVSKFTLLGRLPGTRDSETVTDKLTRMVQTLPEAVLRSLTWDQGPEMAQHAVFTVATGCPVFFADPHSPWQRGTNENFNGQLRYEYPKGTNFNTLTDQDIQDTQDRLNRRARVSLAGMTPAEKLDELIVQTQDGVALTT